MAKKTQKERVEELTNQMNNSIEDYQKDPEEELELLRYLKRFRKYSARNATLIQSQYQGAIGVASYKQHQDNGHQVQKGEKAIRILAPRIQDIFYKKNGVWEFMSNATKKQKQQIENNELKTEKNKLVGYLSVPVFGYYTN